MRYLLGAVLQIDRERHRGQKLFAFSFQQATKAELRDPKGLQLETHPPGRAIASAGWLQFDVAGNSSNDASVVAVPGGLFNLSLGESGNAYFGAASSSLISELGANVEFALEPWSAPKQKRKRQAEVGLRLVGDTDCSHAAAFDNDTV